MKPPNMPAKDNASQARFWRRFNAYRTKAAARFPTLFPCDGRPRPALAIGIAAPLAEAMGWGIGRTHEFLRHWTVRRQYLLALAAGGQRMGLDGAPAGPVSEEHQQRAAVELERRDCRRVTVEVAAHG